MFWNVDGREKGVPHANRVNRGRQMRWGGREGSREGGPAGVHASISSVQPSASWPLHPPQPRYSSDLGTSLCVVLMAASAGLSALALSTALMVSPPSLSSGRACMVNYFTGPATLLLNPLQLHHLTRSQHLTLHHPPSSLENCPIGSPLTSLAAPSQSPGLAPFFNWLIIC